LIVRIHPFPFDAWPPTADELLSRGVNPQVDDVDSAQPSLDQMEVVRKDYAHVTIDWLEIERRRARGSGVLVGRLTQDNVDLMVTAMTHSDGGDIDESLRQLCDSVEFIKINARR
jgi:hypothetical protein